MISRLARAAHPSDRGASTLETLGIVVVAALLVTGVTFSMAAYPGMITTALCRFTAAVGLGPGGCEGGDSQAEDPVTDDDFRPPVCMLYEESEQYSAEFKVWFFTFGENSGFIVQEFADGSVRVTATDGAGIGAGGSVSSSTFDAGKLGDGDNAGLDIDLGGGVKFSYGDTWVFDDRDQWEEMEEQLDDYLLQQEMLKHEGGVWAAKSMGWKEQPKDPEVSYVRTELELSLEAALGLRDPLGPAGPKGEQEFLDPNVGLTLEAKAGGAVIVETNHDTGDQSWTYEVSGSAAAGAEVVVGQGSVQGAVKGAFTVTRGEDGDVTQLVFQSTREVGVSGGLGNDTFDQAGGSTGRTETDSYVTTTTLDVTDENRDLVDTWLAERNDAGVALTLPFGAMEPRDPSDDPFLQLMYEEATMSQLTYHNVKDKTEFEAAIKKGWEFGFAVSAENATASLTDANFLGAPGQDGTRVILPDTECK